jgi:hypothetical protein
LARGGFPSATKAAVENDVSADEEGMSSLLKMDSSSVLAALLDGLGNAPPAEAAATDPSLLPAAAEMVLCLRSFDKRWPSGRRSRGFAE